ncbi:hypothetical protein ETB91_00125 [Lacticaseibacillus rhamnosus]|nr:hypothetical protein ETB91_00125 [Lacticaseibacillus rhamnosus]
MALGVMAGLWPLRPRSLYAGFWAGERVMGVNQNISGLRHNGRALAIAPKVPTRRLLGWRTRYGRKPEHKRPQTYGRALAIATKVLTRRSLHQGACYGE